MVDEAIDKVIADKAPILEKSKELALQIANTNGKIEVLQDQIETEIQNISSKKGSLQSSIDAINTQISIARSDIRELSKQEEDCNTGYSVLCDVEANVKELDDLEQPISILYPQIFKLLSPHIDSSTITDWIAKSQDIESEIETLEAQSQEEGLLVDTIQEKKKPISSQLKIAEQEAKSFFKKFSVQKQEIDEKIDLIASGIVDLDTKIEAFNKERRSISQSVANITAQLSGSITCPSCAHQFILADKDFDISKANVSVAKYNKELQTISEKVKKAQESVSNISKRQKEHKIEKQGLLKQNDTLSKSVEDISNELRSINLQYTSAMNNVDNIKNRIAIAQQKSDNLRNNMFDEAFLIADSLIASNEKRSNQLLESIEDKNGRIQALQDSIGDLKKSTGKEFLQSLEQTISKHRLVLSDLDIEKKENDVSLNNLEIQEQRFVEFKTFLANTKIEALSKVTNEFLENIGSDIRIKFSGFTVLKGGKVRDKISISLLRDGVDCGSFGKFSEGEKARVNLASILAMQKLVNSNCELDCGLDLLVLDEILESVDEDGLSIMFKALNNLGVTGIVVSHGNIAENYPHKLIITKENGESYLNA